MSQQLSIENYGPLNIGEATALTADIAAGVDALPLENNDGYTAGDYVLIGSYGGEKSEMKIVLSVNGNNGLTTTESTVQEHDQYEMVTKLYGTQIRIYRAPNSNGLAPTDDSFEYLAPVNIDFDDIESVYVDPDGSSEYWYKFTYYNPTTSNETSLADSVAVRGGDYGNYCSVDEIRNQAGLQGNRWISNASIDEQRQAAQALINSVLTGKYVVPFTPPVNALIAKCTKLLAAGYLLTKNYGPINTLDTNDGTRMVEEVTNPRHTGLLDRIAARELVLTDATGVSQTTPSGGGVSAWPTAATKDAPREEGGAPRMFRMADREGYESRLY
jgi:hypothetical protein